MDEFLSVLMPPERPKTTEEVQKTLREFMELEELIRSSEAIVPNAEQIKEDKRLSDSEDPEGYQTPKFDKL
ncbi:unnamed protein product, partial [Auanema sp. JU1783]